MKFTVFQVPLLLVASSKAFAPPSCRSVVRGHANSSKLCATQEERDEAMARYLQMADQETLETIQRIEQEKQAQILELKMELYQNLNAALREREMEAMRLQLEVMKQDLESTLEVQAASDALKTKEIQDLRNQLQKLQNERARLVKNSQSQTKSVSPPKSVPKANTVTSTKVGGRAVTTPTGKKPTAKTVAKAPSGAVKNPPSPVVKREPKSKSEGQINSDTGGVKWS
eukprot:scaffold34656_cov178-Amphora_coffeaeformis.AAC.14